MQIMRCPKCEYDQKYLSRNNNHFNQYYEAMSYIEQTQYEVNARNNAKQKLVYYLSKSLGVEYKTVLAKVLNTVSKTS